MIGTQIKLMLCVAAAVVVNGCVSPTPYLDTKLGEAVDTAKQQQMLNPAASSNTAPVAGIGGAPATEAIGRYHDSFKAPPPAFQVFVVPGGGS